MLAQPHQPSHTSTTDYALDKVKKQKIGDTTFVISSFIRTEKAPAFLDILSELLEQELKLK